MADINQFCRLCLSSVTDKHFTIIEGRTKNMLDMLLLHHDFENTASVSCADCLEKLSGAFEFKSTCLRTETTIRDYVDSQEGPPLDIGHIYMSEVDNKQLVDTLEDQKVCRFCMELIQGEFMSVQKMDPMVFQSYIPEMNFDFTRDPVACKTCFDSLLLNVRFQEDCLKVLQKSIQNNVSIETVWIKSEDIKTEIIEEPVEIETMVKSDETVIKSEEFEDDRVKKNFEFQQLGNEGVSKLEIYKCKECDYQTKVKKNLSHHKLRHRDISEIKMYGCNECDYQTKRMRDLKRHGLKHKDVSEVKPYKCNECDFETKLKSYLSSHQVKHRDVSEVTMYKCKECDFQTKYRNALRSHQLKHRDVSEVKMHKCKECDYQTKYRNTLSCHQLKHKNEYQTKMYKCKDCDHQTKRKSDLSRHQLTHKDASESVYKCVECNYQTERKRNLTFHQLMHRDASEVKMYQCKECDYRTKHKSCFSRHRLKHVSDLETFKHVECVEMQVPKTKVVITYL